MKKYREDAFWFEITSGPSGNDGHAIRYYLARCCRCDKTASHKASGLSNDGLRKYFIRLGWYIHKNRTGHICPECQRKRDKHIEEHGEDQVFTQAAARETLDLNEPPSRVARMRALWDQCDVDERLDFMKGIEKARWLEEYGFRFHRQSEPAPSRDVNPSAEFQHGPHIDSMPVEAPLPKIEHPPEVVVEDDDDEPADWWKELQSR